MPLYLTIKHRESVTLATSDGFIRLTLCGVRGHSAKLGFDAPKVVDIVRDSAVKKTADGATEDPDFEVGDEIQPA